MRRLGRPIAAISWLTVLSLLPVQWDQVGQAAGAYIDVSWLGSIRAALPLAGLVGAAPAEQRPVTGFAEESVVLQRAGALGLGQVAEVRPTIDLSDDLVRGPGMLLRLELPTEPILEADLRLKGVGSQRGRNEGRARVYDIPSGTSGSDAVTFGSFLAQAASTPSPTTAVAATGTPTTGPTATPTPLRTATASAAAAGTATGVPAGTATGMPAGTATAIATPTTGAVQTATPTPVPTAPGGNRYSARMQVRYEPTADERGVKETIRFLDRPRTNVVEYELDARGLTAAARLDGSIHLLDHAGRHAFTIPAPTFADAGGQKGAASYRLSGSKLEVVLEQRLVDSGALPLEVDPGLVLASNSNLMNTRPAPWQRVAVTVRDGTQAFFWYDPTANSNGIRLVTSSDNFSTSSSPLGTTPVVAGQGGGGFAVEIDRDEPVSTNPDVDKVYLAVTGTTSSPTTYFLRVYPLSYDNEAKTWAVGSQITIKETTSGSYPQFSSASIALERGTTDYLWVGAEEQTASNKYLFKSWQATYASGQPGAWTETTVPIWQGTGNLGAPSPHYGALVALDDGVAAVSRDSNGMAGSVYTRTGCQAPNCWSPEVHFESHLAMDNGKHFSLLAVTEPLADGSLPLVPMVAFPLIDNNDIKRIQLYFKRYGSSNWLSCCPLASMPTGNDDRWPQLVWDGSSFYLFRLKKAGNNNYQINAQRGRLKPLPLQSQSEDHLELEGDRVWVVEASGERNLQWLGMSRTLQSETVPFYYLRDKGTDQIAAQVRRIEMLGDRASWEYQTLRLPGAGTLKVNLANGNLYYEMVDASAPARYWPDQVKRTYNSQTPVSGLQKQVFSTILGPGWGGLFAPKLQFFEKEVEKSTTNNKTDKIVYWSGDGGQYVFIKKGSGSGTWYAELGMKMKLTRPQTSDDLFWKLEDLQGNGLYFDKTGRPTVKEDRAPKQGEAANDRTTWGWGYSGNGMGGMEKIVTSSVDVEGRRQRFIMQSGHLSKLQFARAGVDPSVQGCSEPDCFEYDYAYDSSGRLQSATLVGNSTEFSRDFANKRIRITYGYDSKGRLNKITTPEGNQYSLVYNTDGTVKYVNLPSLTDGTSSTTDTCDAGRCWQFTYLEGENQTTVRDPRGNDWVYQAFASGSVYDIVYPIDATRTGHLTREWTGDQNKASETVQLDASTSATTRYVYDVNGNRLKVIDAENGETRPTEFTYRAADNRRGSKKDARLSLTTYDYDRKGNLKYVKDAQDFEVRREYDDHHAPTKITDHRSKDTTFVPDGYGQVSSETKPGGIITTIGRDAWSRAETVTVADAAPVGSRTTVYQYDDLGREIEVRVRFGTSDDDSVDLVTRKEYDREGKLIKLKLPTGNDDASTTTYSYDRQGRVTAIDEPIGNVVNTATGGTNDDRPCTTFEYDAVGNQTWSRRAITRTGGGACTFKLADGTPNPNITWAATERTFDRRNQKLTEKLHTSGEYTAYGQGIQTSWEYDLGGRAIKVTDPNGKYVESEYDKLGRKKVERLRVTLVMNGPQVIGERLWAYDEVGNVIQETIPRGNGEPAAVKKYVYDKIQRLTEERHEDGSSNVLRKTTYSYTQDATTNRTTQSVLLSDSPTTYADTVRDYDDLNRLIKVTDAELGTVEYTYDKHGNRRTVRQMKKGPAAPTYVTTSFDHDKANRLTKVTDALGKDSTIRYDKLGNRTKLFGPGATGADFQEAKYDRLGRLLEEKTAPATSTSGTGVFTATTRWTLDGLRASTKDFNQEGSGLSTCFGYDKARRLKLIDYEYTSGTCTADVSFTYDGNGNRLTMVETSPSAQTTSIYDELNRLWTRARGADTLTYRYDLRDLTSVTYPDGKVVSYAYDQPGALRTVEDWRGYPSGQTTYTTDKAGRRTGATLPNGTATSWTYDRVGRPKDIQHTAGGTPFARFEYSYDAAGNPLTLTSTNGAGTVLQTFEYDSLHRLTKEIPSLGAPAIEYEYTDAGNRWKIKVGGVETSVSSYDADNRLLSLTDNGQQTTFTYDRNGAPQTRTEPAGTTTYIYDLARRLSGVTAPGQSAVSFGYDGDGTRVSKTVGMTTSTYVTDTRGLSQVLQEYVATGTRISYVPGLLQHDANQSGNAQWAYLHADTRSTRATTDGASPGVVSMAWDYEPFGTLRRQAPSGTAVTAFQYNGEQKDPETGLYHLRARYYEPKLGRFLGRDRLAGQLAGPQSYNRFAYAMGNPLRYVDPSGLNATEGGDCPTEDEPEQEEETGAQDPDLAAEPALEESGQQLENELLDNRGTDLFAEGLSILESFLGGESGLPGVEAIPEIVEGFGVEPSGLQDAATATSASWSCRLEKKCFGIPVGIFQPCFWVLVCGPESSEATSSETEQARGRLWECTATGYYISIADDSAGEVKQQATAVGPDRVDTCKEAERILRNSPPRGYRTKHTQCSAQYDCKRTR